MGRYLNKKILLFMLICVVAYSIIACRYTAFMIETSANQMFNTLSELTKQCVKIVNAKIEDTKIMTVAFAKYIGDSGITDNKKLVDNLKSITGETTRAKRMGIVDLEGQALTTDDLILNASEQDYFKNALEGKSDYYTNIIDELSGANINVISAPIYNKGQITGVFFVAYSNEKISELLEISSFENQGYFYIVDRSGKIISYPKYTKELKYYLKYTNIYDFLDSEQSEFDLVAKFKQSIENNQGGYFWYEINDEKRFINYEPIEGVDWFLVSVVPYDAAVNYGQNLVFSLIMTAAVTIITFGILLIIILAGKYNAAKKLEQIAYFDELTGKYNWNGFKEKCRTRLSKRPDDKYAIITLDIDNFKIVNDILGENEADEMLKYIANCIDEQMLWDEVCSRISADIFFILMRYNNKLTDRIEAINANIVSKYKSISINLSCGIYIIIDNTYEIAMLTDKANFARHTVKDSEELYAFYSEEHRFAMLNRKDMEKNMQQALNDGEFKTYLQPQVDIKTGEIIGAEALVRWIKADGSVVYPNDFIPLFEKNGFIKKIDMFMFENVCKLVKKYLAQYALNEDFKIAVNFSRNNLSNPNLANDLVSIAKKYGVKTSNLEIELTETLMSENMEVLFDIMKILNGCGFKIAIDDFGSGYSSLNLLKGMTADVLKVDKEFLNEAEDSVKGGKIIRNVIAMSKDLNMITVAEGVETKEQVEFLKRVDCDVAQGYYYYKPMPAEEFEKLLNKKLS